MWKTEVSILFPRAWKGEQKASLDRACRGEGGRFRIVPADRVGRGRLYDSVTHCSRWTHILLMPDDFVLCSVVLRLEPRTSHVLYCTTNCVSSPPFIFYLHMYMCLCRHVYVCWCHASSLIVLLFIFWGRVSFILETLFFSLLPGQVVLGTFCFFLSSAAVLGSSYHI